MFVFGLMITCILFEFKRTSENCAGQLKCQASRVVQNSPGGNLAFVDLSWTKIIRILLNASSIQKQINSENYFTSDFLGFLEGFPADWFPSRRLGNISFPNGARDPNYRMLNRRLNQIKTEIYGEEGVIEYAGSFKRLAIKADFGWINEINIGPFQYGGENYLAIAMHLGDTKGQGAKFFARSPKGVGNIDKIAGFPTIIVPYIKLSNSYASGLLWILPTVKESQGTHTREFFESFAGLWGRADWPSMDQELGEFIVDWKEKCHLPNTNSRAEWTIRFENSNQTGLLLSVGTYFKVLLPYAVCQKMDDKPTNARIVSTFRDVIQKIRERIDVG